MLSDYRCNQFVSSKDTTQNSDFNASPYRTEDGKRTAKSLLQMYLNTSGYHQATPMVLQFFSENNVLYILETITDRLLALTGQRVRIPVDDLFVQTMIDIAGHNLGLSFDPSVLGALNEGVIQHEVQVQHASLRHRKLFYKYFWYQDRIKVFPYGDYDTVTAGEVTVSPSKYMLSNPHRRWQQDYLKETMGLQSVSGNHYEKIPNYLRIAEPKVNVSSVQPCKAFVS